MCAYRKPSSNSEKEWQHYSARCRRIDRGVAGKSEQSDEALFDRYIGIHYSGAEVPESSLKALQVYAAEPSQEPAFIPPPSVHKHWSRRTIAEWLREQLTQGPRAIVGIDHAFSFPWRYFAKHALPLEWNSFLEDFQRHWTTDDAHTYVDFLLDDRSSPAQQRSGNPKWHRLTELQTGAPKSVFQFRGPSTIAKATHAGLHWLLYLRRNANGRIHFWPFDGWQIPPDKSAIVEVYPSLWAPGFPHSNRTPQQHQAWSTAAWMREADTVGVLRAFLETDLTPEERRLALVEGWMLGVS